MGGMQIVGYGFQSSADSTKEFAEQRDLRQARSSRREYPACGRAISRWLVLFDQGGAPV